MTMNTPNEPLDIRQTKHHEALRFTVVAITKPRDVGHVDFEIYEIEGWTSDSEPKLPLWPILGATSNIELTEDLCKAERFLHGSVKWDGCSNWHFDEQDRVMLHGCNRLDLLRFGAVMAVCWDWAAELCTNWDG